MYYYHKIKYSNYDPIIHQGPVFSGQTNIKTSTATELIRVQNASNSGLANGDTVGVRPKLVAGFFMTYTPDI